MMFDAGEFGVGGGEAFDGGDELLFVEDEGYAEVVGVGLVDGEQVAVAEGEAVAEGDLGKEAGVDAGEFDPEGEAALGVADAGGGDAGADEAEDEIFLGRELFAAEGAGLREGVEEFDGDALGEQGRAEVCGGFEAA